MAVEMAQEEEEEGTGQQPAQPAAIGGGAQAGAPQQGTPAGPAAAGMSQPQQQAGKPQGSGSFTNMQDYIKANKPKTQELYKGITAGVEKQAGQLRGQAQKAQQEYLGPQGKFSGGQEFIKQQIAQAGQPAQAVPTTQPTTAQPTTADPAAQQAAPQPAQTAAPAPQPTQQQTNAERFQALSTGAIKGPDFQQQQLAAQKLQDRSQKLGTSEGRFAELQRTVGKQSPRYTSGQRSFDEMLMSRSPEAARQSMEKSRQATAGLGEQIGTTGQQIEAQRAALQQQAQTGVEEARTGLRGELEQRYTDLSSALGPGGQGLSEEQLAGFGLEQGARTYGADLGGALESTRGMTSADTARLDALAKMAGQEGRAFNTGIQGGDLGGTIQEQIAAGKTAYEGAMVDPTQNLAAAQAQIDANAYRTGQQHTAGNRRRMQQQMDYLKGLGYDTQGAQAQLMSSGLSGIGSQGKANTAIQAMLAKEKAKQQASLTGLETQYGGQLEDGGLVEAKTKQQAMMEYLRNRK